MDVEGLTGVTGTQRQEIDLVQAAARRDVQVGRQGLEDVQGQEVARSSGLINQEQKRKKAQRTVSDNCTTQKPRQWLEKASERAAMFCMCPYVDGRGHSVHDVARGSTAADGRLILNVIDDERTDVHHLGHGQPVFELRAEGRENKNTATTTNTCQQVECNTHEKSSHA
jgi:hypothetical protein